MIKQETILYKDTYNIHITKDYIDNILIEEIHYDNNNREIYRNNDVCEIKTYYDINTIIYELWLSKDINKENKLIKRTKETKNFNTEKHYVINKDACTQLCTLNNNDAIKYIKNFIKNHLFRIHNLL